MIILTEQIWIARTGICRIWRFVIKDLLVALFSEDVTFSRGKYVKSLHPVQCKETVNEMGRVYFIHGIQVEMHGYKEAHTRLFRKQYGFAAVHVPDDILS